MIEGIKRLASESPDAAARLELAIAGPLSEDEASLFAADVSPARISLLGSLSRERALALQQEADALLLLAQPTRTQLLNIKVFEYLASGRPILALAAGTEAGRIAEEVGGEAIRADDPVAIADALRRLLDDGLEPPPPDALAPYVYPAPAARWPRRSSSGSRRAQLSAHPAG